MGPMQTSEKALSLDTAANSTKTPRVLVIGAGISGLACASELAQAGQHVIILEARDRIGGRAHTFVDNKINASFDLGASFIHGLAGNPLAELAKEHDLKLFQPDSASTPGDFVPLVWSKEGPAHSEDLSKRLLFISTQAAFAHAAEYAQEGTDRYPSDAETVSDFLLDEIKSSLYAELKYEDEKEMARQMIESREGWTGAAFKDLSLKYWQSEVTYPGDDATIVNGYRGIYDFLAKTVEENAGCEIRLNEEVTSIRHGEGAEMITVETKNPLSPSDAERPLSTSNFKAEYVVCTLPLGVLKERPPHFSPPLSLRRREAIQRLQMGLLNKIVVTYDRCFWLERQAVFSFLPSQASEAFIPNLSSRALVAQNYKLITGTNTLVFYLGAGTGAATEKLSDEEIKERVHNVMKHHFGTEENFPKDGQGPTSVIVTRWLSDPYSCGSYSYIRAAKEGESPVPTPCDFAEIARPAWGERLYFAGEATNADHYATVHGALITGRTQARAILNAMKADNPETEFGEAAAPYADSACDSRTMLPAVVCNRASKDAQADLAAAGGSLESSSVSDLYPD